jgi:non-ribosomal peptide synthase protein (TIGR01720 family)
MKSVRDPESAESFWNRFIGNSKEFRLPDKKTGLIGTGIMSRALSNDITESLRYDVPPRFNVTQEDLILTGIKLTLDQWKSSVIRCLDIENQGRTIDGLQVANDRTVGWFTVIYPFTLDLASDMSVVDAILSVKEEKASIRPHMHEYGVLYSLGLGDERIRNKSAMLFNYLGVLDDEYRGNEMFAVSEYAIGDCANPNIAPVYPIAVDCSIVADRLEFNVKYDASLYTNSEISEFLQLLSVNLESIVEAGKRQSEVIVTRSDLGEAAIDMKDEDLDVLDSLLTEMI